MGLIPAALYLIVLVISQTLFISNKEEQLQYNAAAFSVCFMILLGFCDDVVDLKWRYKLIMPLFASLPIIMAYSGTTFIVIPKILRPMLGFSIDLGIFYKLYMCMLTLFCTNSINIYAGINGIESGQSIVIACSALTHNIIVTSISGNLQTRERPNSTTTPSISLSPAPLHLHGAWPLQI
jgi:UDP-N-acetylglucosamine--dolichyl-phosphate N-acetylglucosaminephosphotransferase